MILILFLSLLNIAAATETSIPQLPYNAYNESRFNFRETCETLKLECKSWSVPTITTQELTIDYGIHRNSMSNRLLVVVCGTHGAEAMVGCSLLNAMMSNWVIKMKDKGINLLLVHAVNPYGFKFFRRVTENNVDLNRNFIIGDRPKNEGYQKLRANLEPEGEAGHVITGFWKLSLKMIWRLATREFTLPEMRQAVASGQYDSPRGMFFGGERPEPQVEFFKDLFTRSFAGQRDIVLIDIHTGLGKRGVMHLMPTDNPAPETLSMLNRILPSDEEHKSVYELTVSNSNGFYKTYGSFNDFAQQLAAPGQTMLALTMEFGTLGDDMISQLRSLNRMVMENQGRQFGYTSENNQSRVKTEFMELFAPQAQDWRADVSRKTHEVFSLIHKNL